MMFSYKQIIIFVVYSLFLVLAGWKANTYYTGYKLSQQQKLEKIVQDGLSKIQQDNAKHYEDVQQELDKKKTEIIEKKIPVIVDRPIYMNNCVDQEGVDALQKYKQESQDIIRGKKNAK